MSARRQRRSKATPRRKAGRKPKAKRKLVFRLVVEAQEMAVVYTPDFFGGEFPLGQFEFRSPRRPPRRIAISETGYYCHMASMEEIESAESPQAYARAFVLGILDRERRASRGYDDRQLSMF